QFWLVAIFCGVVLGHARGHVGNHVVQALPEIASTSPQGGLHGIGNLSLQALSLRITDGNAKVVSVRERLYVDLEGKLVAQFLRIQESQLIALHAHSGVVFDLQQRAKATLISNQILESSDEVLNRSSDCPLVLLQLITMLQVHSGG